MSERNLTEIISLISSELKEYVEYKDRYETCERIREHETQETAIIRQERRDLRTENENLKAQNEKFKGQIEQNREMIKEKDDEIERLKGYNDEAVKKIKEMRATIKEREAEIGKLRRNKKICENCTWDKEKKEAQRKYKRLVSCIQRWKDNKGRNILIIHRDNEKKLKEIKNV